VLGQSIGFCFESFKGLIVAVFYINHNELLKILYSNNELKFT